MSTNKQVPSIFAYQSNSIRTANLDGQVWFVAKDVCNALGITWGSSTLRPIPPEWKGVMNFVTPSQNSYGRGGGVQTLRVISEFAVYKLAFRSNKPEADTFTNWVASEVLPSIRKTGKYELKHKQLPLPKPKQTPLQLSLEGLYEEISKKHYEMLEWEKGIDRQFSELTAKLYIDVCRVLPHPQMCIDAGVECLHMARYEGRKQIEEAFNYLYYAYRYAKFFARSMNA